MDNNNPSYENKELAYDFRQRYANLGSTHIELASEGMINSNFPLWFKSLRDLKTVTFHKWEKQSESLEEYNKKINYITQLANIYRDSWLGESEDEIERTLIEDKLRDLHEFIFEKIRKLFGESYKTSGF